LIGACWAQAGAARATATARTTAVTRMRLPDSFFVLIDFPPLWLGLDGAAGETSRGTALRDSSVMPGKKYVQSLDDWTYFVKKKRGAQP
jgi:hypothetical protein